MLDRGDFESISYAGNAATKYGTGMRYSPIDSRSAGQPKNYSNSTATSGNEAFGKFTTNDFDMQQPYLKPGGNANAKNNTAIG